MLKNLVQSFSRTPFLTRVNQINKPLNTPLLKSYTPYNFSLAATIGLHYQINRYTSLYGRQLATKKFWLGRERLKKKCLSTVNRSAERSPKKKKKTHHMRYKINCHKGLLNRIKISGPRWDRKYKFKSANHTHLLRYKTKSNKLRARRTRYISKADTWKVEKLIPQFKNNRFKKVQ